MKKIFYICIAALAVAATSCSTKPDIDIDTHGAEGLEFVHFENLAESWLVTADDESYDFKLVVGTTKAPAEDVTYNVTVGEKNTTGVEGTDFSIANKSVTFKAGQYTAELPVKVLYETTGVGFVLELVLSLDESLVNPSYGNSVLVSVKSDKVTIDWEWLVGEWDAVDWNYYENKQDGNPYKATISKGATDEDVILYNIWGSDAELKGKVDFENKTITIPGYQLCIDYTEYDYGLFYFVAVDPEAEYDIFYNADESEDLEHPVVATMAPAGIVIDNYDFIMIGGKYNGYTYAGGLRTNLTR